MINKLKHKLKLWLSIYKNEANIIDLYEELDQLRDILKERTEYHLDVHQYAQHNSQIILIGKFRNQDFVKCYDIPDRDFKNLIQHCRELEKYAKQGKIDAWPSIHARIKNDL